MRGWTGIDLPRDVGESDMAGVAPRHAGPAADRRPRTSTRATLKYFDEILILCLHSAQTMLQCEYGTVRITISYYQI